MRRILTLALLAAAVPVSLVATGKAAASDVSQGRHSPS
jgi:hypothetical protein